MDVVGQFALAERWESGRSDMDLVVPLRSLKGLLMKVTIVVQSEYRAAQPVAGRWYRYCQSLFQRSRDC